MGYWGDGVMGKNYKLQITNKKIIKSFCGGSRGAVFSKRASLAAGGKSNFIVVMNFVTAYIIGNGTKFQ